MRWKRSRESDGGGLAAWYCRRDGVFQFLWRLWRYSFFFLYVFFLFFQLRTETDKQMGNDGVCFFYEKDCVARHKYAVFALRGVQNLIIRALVSNARWQLANVTVLSEKRKEPIKLENLVAMMYQYSKWVCQSSLSGTPEGETCEWQRHEKRSKQRKTE